MITLDVDIMQLKKTDKRILLLLFFITTVSVIAFFVTINR